MAPHLDEYDALNGAFVFQDADLERGTPSTPSIRVMRSTPPSAVPPVYPSLSHLPYRPILGLGLSRGNSAHDVRIKLLAGWRP